MTPIDEDFKANIKKKLEKSTNKTLPVSLVSPTSDPFDNMSKEELAKLDEEVNKYVKENTVKESQMFDDKDVEIIKPKGKTEEKKPKITPDKKPKIQPEKKTKVDDFELDDQTIMPTETVEEYPLSKESIVPSIRGLPSESVIREMIKRYKFVKSELVDKSDFVPIKGKQYLKKSGYRKFVNAYGISVELIDMNVYELYDDRHAEVRLKVSVPSGQTVEGMGICSWSELHTKTLHNLKATAWTRAFNRGIADLVAYGEVSAEEVMDVSKLELEEDF